MFRSILAVIALAVATALAQAEEVAIEEQSEFLPRGPGVVKAHGDDVFARLLGEALEARLGGATRNNVMRRAARLEDDMWPTTSAPSASSQDLRQKRYEDEASRDVLYRFFMRTRGWLIRGLDPAVPGALADISVLKVRAPETLRELISSQFSAPGRQSSEAGLSGRSLALVAATIERLLTEDALDVLRAVYKVHEAPLKGAVSSELAREILETFTSAFIIGENVTAMTVAELREQHAAIGERFPVWKETLAFLTQVQRSMFGQKSSHTFAELGRVVEQVGERFWHFEEQQCQALRSELLESERHGDGRVLLSDFYRKALDQDKWQFSESVSYLRSVGALDESDAARPRVIVANYVGSRANCVAESPHSAVCCLNVCEGLRSSLDTFLATGANVATPAEIMAVLPESVESASARLLSPDVLQGRSSAAPLLEKLEEIAAANGGHVPLRGRLFAQWLHYAYPRACPFPHESGTINPMGADAWLATSEQDSSATEEEMKQFLLPEREARKCSSKGGSCAGVDFGMWVDMEELLEEPTKAKKSGKATTIRHLFLVAALASFGVSMLLQADTILGLVRGKVPGQEDEKKQMNKYHL